MKISIALTSGQLSGALGVAGGKKGKTLEDLFPDQMK